MIPRIPKGAIWMMMPTIFETISDSSDMTSVTVGDPMARTTSPNRMDQKRIAR